MKSTQPPATLLEATMENRGSTFNDSVHGSITLPPLCVLIVDTVEFQRMRNLKQLGLAYLVYPGASHNRFEHSLGVCHLAGRIVDQLNHNREPKSDLLITEKEKLCLQIAGLCHDMGHGPFSHAWEGFLKARAKKPKDKKKPNEAEDKNQKEEKEDKKITEKPKKWKHEKCSIEMFQDMIVSNPLVQDGFANNSLDENDIEFIKALIYHEEDATPPNINEKPPPMKDEKPPPMKKEKPYLYEIISNSLNGIDVDKWDYFLRDSKYLNLNQSFDHNRLLTTCRVMKVEEESHKKNGKMHIAYRDKDVANVWDMFQVRAQLHSKAYQHPVVKILEQMWSDALIAADDAGFTVSNARGESVGLSEAQTEPKIWKYVTDHIFHDILNSSDRKFEIARKILLRILNRDMYYKIGDVVEVENPSEENIVTVSDAIKQIMDNTFDYCLINLSFDMGKMEEVDNFFFYTKEATTAKSIDISTGAVFPIVTNQERNNMTRGDIMRKLKREKIMVVCKRSKRSRTLTDEVIENNCAELIRDRTSTTAQLGALPEN